MSNEWHNAFREFVRKFWHRYDWHLRDKQQRQGQARMNALRDVAPELYEIVSGTNADCFYNDVRVPQFDSLVFGFEDPTWLPANNDIRV